MSNLQRTRSDIMAGFYAIFCRAAGDIKISFHVSSLFTDGV